ncbi:hypothetical protein D3C87_616560 [compost metagenome]
MDTGPFLELDAKLTGQRAGRTFAEAHIKPAGLQPHKPHKVAHLCPHDGIAVLLAEIGNILHRIDENLRLRPLLGFGCYDLHLLRAAVWNGAQHGGGLRRRLALGGKIDRSSRGHGLS